MTWIAAGAGLCYATQALAGWLAWHLLGGGAMPLSMRFGAALLVGPALVTVQMVAYHALGLPFALPWLMLPWWLVGLVVAVGAGRGPVGSGSRGRLRQTWFGDPLDALETGEPHPRAGASWPRRLLAVEVAVLTLAVAARAFALPIHEGDEVNNFALFAKVFGSLGSLAPARLTALMEPGHVEYPHLVALNQAWLFALDADSAPWSARGFDVLGALALFLVVAGTVGAPTWRGLFAATICSASPVVLSVAVGFADVRLLATFVLLGSEARRVLAGGDPRAPLRLALVLGTAALTKNEGAAVALCGVVVLLVATLRQRAFARGLPAILLAVLLLALWPALRRLLGLGMPYVDRALAPPLDVLLAQTPRVLAAWRQLLLPLDGAELLRAGVVGWMGLMLVFAFAWRDKTVRWLAAAWVVHLSLYTYVLGIARPGDLEALLVTAAHRLALHTTAWPVLVLGAVCGRIGSGGAVAPRASRAPAPIASEA